MASALKICAFSPLKQQQHRVGRAGVEACGGFIQEEDRRVDNQLHPNVCPLPLATRNPTNQLSAHLHKHTTIRLFQSVFQFFSCFFVLFCFLVSLRYLIFWILSSFLYFRVIFMHSIILLYHFLTKCFFLFLLKFLSSHLGVGHSAQSKLLDQSVNFLLLLFMADA